MSNNLVPRVSLTEAVSAISVPQANATVIGVLGLANGGTSTANTIYEVKSVSEADTYFGSNYSNGATLVPMIRRAFDEGASVVKAVKVGAPTIKAGTSGAPGLLTADSLAGVSTITVASATIYAIGDIVCIGTENTYDYEEKKKVLTAVGTTVTFTEPLLFNHYIGEAARAITPKTSTDYVTAINNMEADEDKSIVICDLNDDATAALLVTMCNNSFTNYNTPCVFIRGPELTDLIADIITNAQASNSSRCINVFPLLTDFNGRKVSGGETAAGVAGAIAGNGVPKLNHNFTTFSSFGGVSAAITDMDAAISGGVTPIELKYNSIHIVRFVTTYTKKNGVTDKTWQEAAVRLNVDFIEKSINKQIQSNYMQKGNTGAVRSAIKLDIINLLKIYADNYILVGNPTKGIPAYKDPVVTTDPVDPTKVNIDIEMSPGRPLNFISLNFKVYL